MLLCSLHLEIVISHGKWLKENLNTIQVAEENGHLEVVEYLSEIQRNLRRNLDQQKALCIIFLAPRNGIFAPFFFARKN